MDSNNNQVLPNKTKKNFPLLVIVIIIFLALTGSTLAYFYATSSNSIFTGNLSNVLYKNGDYYE